MNKKLLYTILAVVSLVLLVIAGGSFYLIDYALDNSSRTRNEPNRFAYIVKKYPELKPWIDSLEMEKSLRDTFIVMPDGERQHAIFVRSRRGFGRTAVVVHGYKDRAANMLHIARIYNKMLGYNVLLPDLHGHGQSDGDDVQMGWKDRLDVLHWIQVSEKMFRNVSEDSSRVVVHGISMGAATTMCVAGEPTPAYVKCFVEDCGYTSAWDEFVHELKNRFGMPPFPLLYTSSALCKLRYGWSFGEASPLSQVAKCRKPMLFIHGGNDVFVPTSMVYPLYKAKPEPKELWIAPGSAHALSYHDHKAEYVRRVVGFVSPLFK